MTPPNGLRRVAITGIGIVSPIGNSAEEVAGALRAGRSGIEASSEMAERGFRSQIAGTLKLDLSDHVDKRTLRFMGPGAAYAHIAMEHAIADAGLSEADVVSPSTGLVAGSGGPSTSAMFEAHRTVVERGSPKRIGPFAVPKCMSSTVSANLSTAFRIKGVNFSITSACSTSLHCIGMAADQVALGRQEIVFAGGGEELDWTLSCLFDAMGAMSSRYNDTPKRASRPYDEGRDGFVIAGGGGMVVLEPLERARARGAHVYAEVAGFGATSDGADMVAPSGEGGERAMRLALATVGERRVDYVNAHGTSTAAGDVPEVQAVRDVLGEDHPPIGSTKSMTGHSQGATGVHEVVYCLLMMRDGFIAPSINVESLDPALRAEEIVTRTREADLDCVLSNSFGFGGTNASIALTKLRD